MGWRRTGRHPFLISGMDFIYNDGGRAAGGFKGIAGDCVCRAIAIATERPYKDVYDSLRIRCHPTRSHFHCVRGPVSTPRTGVHRSVYDPYLKSLGFTWHPTMGIGTGCKVHLCSEELPAGRLLVKVSKHLCAVIDGVIHDTHDCSRAGTRCVYGYYQCIP